MALLLLESWDGYGGDTTQAARKWTAGTPATSSSHARSGWAFHGGSGQTAGRAIAPATTTLIFGCRVYFVNGQAPAQSGVVVGFVSSASYTGFNAVCALNLNTTGTLYVSRGFNGGTTLATSVATLTPNALNTLVAKFVLGGSGSYDVYLNGVSVLSASGVNMGTTTVGGIHLGGETSANYALDDLWLLDSSGTALNDLPAEALIIPCCLPNADGAAAELTPSTGTDHYAVVDEATANDDTDYNSGAGGGGLKDLYGFDLSILSGRTRYASQFSMCAKSTSGAATLAGVTRAAGVTYVGPDQAVTTSYAYYEDQRTA